MEMPLSTAIDTLETSGWDVRADRKTDSLNCAFWKLTPRSYVTAEIWPTTDGYMFRINDTGGMTFMTRTFDNLAEIIDLITTATNNDWYQAIKDRERKEAQD